jgi:eukaryotic-like serine/threonine-protein kinase
MARIGAYQIIELLGEGGGGRVHAAFDSVLEREVAIKSLRPELLNDKSFIERFRNEATHLARLNHPNITTLHSLFSEGHNLYMVMERVRGQSLDELLRTRGARIGIKDSLTLITQVADGLAYAHSMGVIHRDIKPANLMITDTGLVKIMDFGIARARGSQRLTRDGGIVGTLPYMAPEQLRGEPGDERSDLYSLAIVLYEMLAGHVPFAAATDYALMQAQIYARPPRLCLPDLAPDMESTLLQALAKKPERRFDSVQAFRDTLRTSALRYETSSRGRGRALVPLPMAIAARWLARIDRATFMRFTIIAGVAVLAASLLGLGAWMLLPRPPSAPSPLDLLAAPKIPSIERAAATGSGRLPPTIIPPPQTSRPQPAVLERERHAP